MHKSHTSKMVTWAVRRRAREESSVLVKSSSKKLSLTAKKKKEIHCSCYSHGNSVKKHTGLKRKE